MIDAVGDLAGDLCCPTDAVGRTPAMTGRAVNAFFGRVL